MVASYLAHGQALATDQWTESVKLAGTLEPSVSRYSYVYFLYTGGGVSKDYEVHCYQAIKVIP